MGLDESESGDGCELNDPAYSPIFYGASAQPGLDVALKIWMVDAWRTRATRAPTADAYFTPLS
jgi:hypothetical protein